MVKLLHTKVKIPFANPYVVRVQYGDSITYEDAVMSHRKIMRNAYKLMQGTWGYSNLDYEQISTVGEQAAPMVWTPAAGGGPPLVSYNPGYSFALRAYVVFKDEMDALQFRLSIDNNSRQVKMWPERWFTIHEVVETDEY